MCEPHNVTDTRAEQTADYSLYWQLTNDWTDNMEQNEDGETMDTQRRKLRRGDKNVTSKNIQVVSPAASPHPTESLTETISHEGLSPSKTEHPTLKREILRTNNKYAARKCRQNRKEYVKHLEDHLAVLEDQNKTLIEELNSLRDLYCEDDPSV